MHTALIVIRPARATLVKIHSVNSYVLSVIQDGRIKNLEVSSHLQSLISHF